MGLTLSWIIGGGSIGFRSVERDEVSTGLMLQSDGRALTLTFVLAHGDPCEKRFLANLEGMVLVQVVKHVDSVVANVGVLDRDVALGLGLSMGVGMGESMDMGIDGR